MSSEGGTRLLWNTEWKADDSKDRGPKPAAAH